MEDKGISNLLQFYRSKSRDGDGGQFYKVFNGAANIGTFWGRDEQDLHNHLNRSQLKFTRLLPLN